ncbi:hypothetical protein [Streptomyces sp. NPDC058964]|uniref:hypothetical protein n=1 Tax=Streptomyces sp. NPDC058964 TaxID=3346681 RepID=UPI00369933AA
MFLREADLDVHREGERVHLTPEDAGGIAREARVRELLVTRVGSTLSRESATVRAAAAFGRSTDTAREGDTRII